MNAVTTNDSRHAASYRTFLQYLSLLLLAVVLHAAPVLAVDPPLVFRDVASDAGLHEPLRGMMAHAAAWGDVNGDGWIDLFVGNKGKLGKENLLYHDRGDVDRDGDLDMLLGSHHKAPWRRPNANGDYAISWIRTFGKGRVFHCTLGHAKTAGTNPAVALCDVDNRRAADAYAKFPDLPKYEDFRVWDLWLAGAAQRDYHELWYGSPGDNKWRGNWKRWRDFFTSGLGWAAPHSAALPFMACKIDHLWDATDVSSESRSIRVVPTVPVVCTVGYPAWEMVRYEVPARGKLVALTFTWHRGAMHYIEKALGEYPEWRNQNPKPWWTHGGSAFVGTRGKLDATHYGDNWEVYPAELAESELLKGIRGEGHERQWLSAIGGRGETASNFAVSGPLTEFFMLGNVATRIGRPFTYDPVTGQVLDNEAAQAALHQEYRKGWTL